jgi:hypothetical protein
MNLFMNPSLFASLSYHKTLYNSHSRSGREDYYSSANGGKAYNPALGYKKKREAKEARNAREEACNRL